MKRWIENIVTVMLCALFLVAGTGFNIHCHCQSHSDACHCVGHTHQPGHCHTHYIHLADAARIVTDHWLPQQSAHELLFMAMAPVNVVGVYGLMLYRGERVHDGRVPIYIFEQRYREELCQWLI